MLLNGNKKTAIDPSQADDAGNTALHLACMQVSTVLQSGYGLLLFIVSACPVTIISSDHIVIIMAT